MVPIIVDLTVNVNVYMCVRVCLCESEPLQVPVIPKTTYWQRVWQTHIFICESRNGFPGLWLAVRWRGTAPDIIIYVPVRQMSTSKGSLGCRPQRRYLGFLCPNKSLMSWLSSLLPTYSTVCRLLRCGIHPLFCCCGSELWDVGRRWGVGGVCKCPGDPG